jgi:hypothetical protein
MLIFGRPQQKEEGRRQGLAGCTCVRHTLLAVCLGHPLDPSRGSGTLTRTCPPIFYEYIVPEQMRTHDAYFWPPTTETEVPGKGQTKKGKTPHQAP